MDECDAFCEMLDAWFKRGFVGGSSFEDFQMCESLKARYRDLVARARQCACSGNNEQLVAVQAEIEQWRAFLITQQENLASYAIRAGKDLARAEELALRPHMQKLLPVLDALDMAYGDARRPECNPSNLRSALEMIKDGLSGHIEGVRGLLPAPI